MTDTVFARHGATIFDGSALGYSDTLEPLDPGRDILLALFKKAIESELGSRFDVVTASTVLVASEVVEDSLPLRPNPELMQQRKAAFPLLCVYRSGTATIEEHTLEIDKITQPSEVVYTLGPLPASDIRKLGDILSAIPKLVQLVIKRRGHPEFDSGALQFFEGKGHFASVRAVSYETGQAQFGDAGSPTYWTCQVNIETTELADGLPGETTDLVGAGYSIGIGNEGGVLPDALNIDTESTP